MNAFENYEEIPNKHSQVINECFREFMKNPDLSSILRGYQNINVRYREQFAIFLGTCHTHVIFSFLFSSNSEIPLISRL
jgi:hypothetical protein